MFPRRCASCRNGDVKRNKNVSSSVRNAYDNRIQNLRTMILKLREQNSANGALRLTYIFLGVENLVQRIDNRLQYNEEQSGLFLGELHRVLSLFFDQ